ncbi:MAG: tRNA dihydrouridine(20/20a) synthase DusA [Pseudomonadota bacterium]
MVSRLSVAPMMDWTDRHCRYLHRQISRHTLLYTEMVTAPALIHGDRARLLRFDTAEHPVALQIGGSDPAELAEAARIGEAAGYDEINLNVGCPSDRVQSGRFGACLMAEPDLVARCVRAMKDAVAIEVTVKCRIGIDDQKPAESLPNFIQCVADQGIHSFTIHARKAWLQGLSPKENRTIPPLDYPLVYAMKERFPALEIILNGGLETLQDVQNAVDNGLDGAMIGRAAYHEPMRILASADQLFDPQAKPRTAKEVIFAMQPYIAAHLAEGGALHHISRHMLGMFSGQPGARAWRRHLSENAHQKNAGWSVIADALEQVEEHQQKASQNA